MVLNNRNTSGRYYGHNCANRDTSMKFGIKVDSMILMKNPLLARKKINFSRWPPHILEMASLQIGNTSLIL